MTFAKRQLFFISIILSLCLFTAPLTETLYADSIFTKIKDKASNYINKQIDKYTSRDYWVDKASSTIATKVVAKPVKLATAALGMAIGTALGGPVGASLGAYIGNKVAAHACKIVATPVVKNVINDKLDNGGSIGFSTISKACKDLDMSELACDTTGAVVGDIIGSAIGGMAGAAIMACVGGGTILPIIGTITFASLGAKYGEKLGNWIGTKLGRNAYNSTYKALTGVDRNEGANSNVILQTINDVKSVDKKEVAKNTTSGIVGDVIGSALGTLAGATLSAFTTGGSSTILVKWGDKWGSNLGSKIGNWVGEKFFNDKKGKIEESSNTENITIGNGTESTITVSNEIPVSSSATVTSKQNPMVSANAEAAYAAYQIAYEKYADALADSNCTQEMKQKAMEDYHNCYEAYQRVILNNQ